MRFSHRASREDLTKLDAPELAEEMVNQVRILRRVIFWRTAALFAMFSLVLAYGFWQGSRRIDSNCAAVSAVRAVVDRVLAQPAVPGLTDAQRQALAANRADLQESAAANLTCR